MHILGAAPTYVLQARLQNGQKIPRWDLRSRRGQYLGVSPLHASSVGLVRNPKTGRVSPQFHMVFDDWFETINCSIEYDPITWHNKWEDCILLKTHKADYFNEDAEYIPELGPEWKSLEEIKKEKIRLQRKNIEVTYQPNDNKSKKVKKEK